MNDTLIVNTSYLNRECLIRDKIEIEIFLKNKLSNGSPVEHKSRCYVPSTLRLIYFVFA